MKKTIILIIAMSILLSSILTVAVNAAPTKESCQNCHEYIYYPYCSGVKYGNQTTNYNCVLHDNCKIVKRELFYCTTTAANSCGCSYYLTKGYNPNTHSDYTTHTNTSIGRAYTCMY